MRCVWAMGAAVAMLVFLGQARAAMVSTSIVSGESRPDVLTYTPSDHGPGADATANQSHSIHAFGADLVPTTTTGALAGEELPPRDPPAESLIDVDRYGQFRGQFEPPGDSTDAAGPDATAVPIPPALLLGLAGLLVAGWATHRRKAITR